MTLPDVTIGSTGHVEHHNEIHDAINEGVAGGASPSVLYVMPDGDDGNDGQSWTTAKLTVAAAVAALPSSIGTIHIRDADGIESTRWEGPEGGTTTQEVGYIGVQTIKYDLGTGAELHIAPHGSNGPGLQTAGDTGGLWFYCQGMEWESDGDGAFGLVVTKTNTTTNKPLMIINNAAVALWLLGDQGIEAPTFQVSGWPNSPFGGTFQIFNSGRFAWFIDGVRRAYAWMDTVLGALVFRQSHADKTPLAVQYSTVDGTQTADLFKAMNNAGTTLWAITATGATEFLEQSDPAAPASDRARLYSRDNGSGKTQLCVRFATGAVQVLATEP